MQSAVLNGNAARLSNGCKDCNKVGPAIRPVVAMLVPAALRGGTTAELKALDSHYIADDLIPMDGVTNIAFLVSLPPKPDLSWDIYVVDREGLLRLSTVA